MQHRSIDTTYDVRTDAGRTRTGAPRDPDRFSPTLRSHHKQLWSKPLPSGEVFALTDTRAGEYLYHCSDIGEFFFGSDSIIHTLASFPGMKPIVAQVPAEVVAAVKRVGYTVGGMTLFPSNRVDGKPTINGARGMHPGLRDRFDLALECIRRYYVGGLPNPLGEVLARYDGFFALFNDFQGYINFFLLQDIVEHDYASVQFFSDFTDFPTRPLPRTAEDYLQYLDRCATFVSARNRRIAATAAQTVR